MMTKKKLKGLIYVGGGYLPGVPARDLDAAEVEQWGEWYLLQSKLYAKSEPIEEIESEDSWEEAG
jgi:hypothetical protein